MANRSPVRTPTRLLVSPPQQGNFGYLRGTVTGSEERAQGLPGSAAVVRYVTVSVVLAACPSSGSLAWHSLRLATGLNQAKPGFGPGPGACCQWHSGRWGARRRFQKACFGTQAGTVTVTSMPRPAGLRAGSPRHWHWRCLGTGTVTLKVPTTVGAKERRRPPSSTRDRDTT